MASQLEGVAALTAQLVELGVKFAAPELKGTARDAMEIVEHRARSTMPQGTEPHITYRGRLVAPGFALSTLHIETKIDKKRGAAVATLGVGREAFYVVQFVELGTATMPARPWLRPSFESTQDAVLSQITVSLTDRVEKAVARKTRASRR